ncbi:single-stranded-DNA-specific exonuclease [Desulfohalotomaculum tongense]|uniref:single-stranded-DNA-specific exonuclease RecJ n=1 Tax=Desulforadius tongensis TaxID=1216062 RepID=UPI00195AC578|nr:single-stranded-DNA-specific exonuclease RecJ [Desulforadius tongensis]MBM7855098.1 single-stranded-DNA-specific exonuclease [Desulforadius tongensis]
MKCSLNKRHIPAEYLHAVGGSEILARILLKRGITPGELEGFLNWEKYTPTGPEELPGLSRAVDIVKQALDKGQKICVYGDYDVDGVTSTVLLVSVLKLLNADVIYKVPDRFKEGYGLNAGVIKKLWDRGVNLIITCDCGIANGDEIALARDLGMQVVVTDHHHLPPELPGADAIVNSQMLPDGHRAKYMPGVAVAYFLAQALLERYHRRREAEQFIDLVALGVIADVVPLKGENRYFVQRGLPEIRRAGRPGIAALIEVAGLDRENITEEDIGFQMVPRLNAAGRMKTARYAVELLLSTGIDGAKKWAGILDELNQARKQIGHRMLEEAEAMLQGEETGPIVLFQPHWHHGIIGITAGRLCEKYRVPVILMGRKEDGQTVVGSARSVEGIHIFEVLQQCGDYLDRYGGHAGAAGLSLHRDKLPAFTKICKRILTEKLAGIKGKGKIKYDLEMPLAQATAELFYQLQTLAPYGEGWPQPLLYCPGVNVLSARFTTGKKHLRLVLEHRGQRVPAIHWWGADSGVQQGDLLYSIAVNRWRGEEKVQLVVNELITPAAPPVNERKTIFIQRVLDCRRWRELGEKPPQFAGAVYFYEGLPLKDFPHPTADRYSITRAGHLVLLSCPPSNQIFKEIIALSGAENLVLAYSPLPDLSPAECIKRVMSYIKYVDKKLGGKTTVFELAAITGQTELLVMAVIRLLRDNGLLEVGIMEKGRLSVKLKRGAGLKTAPPVEIKDMLAESSAYRRYMNNITPELLLKNIN